MAVAKKEVEILQVYVDKQLAEEIRRLAREKGLTVSSFIRSVLISYINRRTKAQRQER